MSKMYFDSKDCLATEECDFCGDVVLTSELLSVNNGKESMLMCRKCRKLHKIETEEDIIFDLKQNIKTPIEIVKELDKYVVGQDDVKKAIAVEVYNHFLRISNKDILGDTKVKKNNILLTGQSGTGKTLIAQSLAKILGVPFAIANATSLTESGYVGKDVESVLSNLLRNSGMNPNRAKYGIVFIDEIDKIAKKGDTVSITRDVSGEGVQQALLTMVEGSVIGVPEQEGRVHPQQKLIDIDTTDILFICGGAFDGIEDIVKDRLKVGKGSSSIGFNSIETKQELSEKDIRLSIDLEDLQRYGMIPEFLGRFPAICNLEPLDIEQLVAILKADNGLIKEYKTLLKLQNKDLVFEEESLEKIAQIALKQKVGARALRGIMTSFMRELMFYAPSEDKTLYQISNEDIENYFEKAI